MTMVKISVCETILPSDKADELPPQPIEQEGRPEEGSRNQTREVPHEKALVRVSLHCEQQKFGGKSIDDLVTNRPDNGNLKRAIEEHGIQVVGIDISKAQNYALFAIQKLLERTNYRGDRAGTEYTNKVNQNAFRFTGTVPVVRFSKPDYLIAYGLTKRKTKRGFQEFKSNERTEALEALRELGEKRFLFYYRRKYWVKKEEKYDVITAVRPLLTIVQGYEDLTKSEMEKIVNGETSKMADDKLRMIEVEVSPILVDQIDKYFLLKPANINQEIRLYAPHSSKYAHRLVEYLVTQGSRKKRKNENMLITIELQKLARQLRMDSWLKKRNWKAIKGSLAKGYHLANQLGYVTSFRTIKGTKRGSEEIVLNPSKFVSGNQAKPRHYNTRHS